MSVKGKSAAGGFTLLEILVATAIFSVLIGALYSVLFSGLRLRESAHAAVEAGQPVAQVAMIMRRDLANMTVPAERLAGAMRGEPAGMSGGQADEIEFYTTSGIVRDEVPWGEIQRVTYYLEAPAEGEETEGFDLIRQVERNLLTSTTIVLDDELLAQWRMLRGVDELTLRYWDGEAWLDNWDTEVEEGALPRAAQLRVEFVADEAGRRDEPLEIVAEIAPEPRPTPEASETSGASASPTPTPTPTPGPGGGGGGPAGGGGGRP